MNLSAFADAVPVQIYKILSINIIHFLFAGNGAFALT